MSSMILSGDTSGSVTVTVPAVAGTNTVTIPAVTGTAVVSGQNSAITAGTAQASTSGTSIDFTGIPSWVKRITVMFNNVSTNGSSTYLVQVGAGSVTATGYISSGGYYNSSNSAQATSSTSGFIIYNTTSGRNHSGTMQLTLLGSNLWIASGVLAGQDAIMETTVGTVTLGGTLDRIRITTTNGTDTFDAGSINILYE